MNRETHQYFNGPEEETVPTFSSDEYAASLSQKGVEDLCDLESILTEDIDRDKENELKKKNASVQGIPLQTLPFKIQHAEELENLHTQQLAVVRKIKKEKSVKGKSILGSFLNF